MFTCRQRRSRAIHLRTARLGAVAVEFAVVAPIMLGVVVGLTELGRIYSVQNTLECAAREGARFAALDRTGMLAEGASANAKLVSDVKNFLATAGFDRDRVEIHVVSADDPSQNFDLDDTDNDMKLFQVRIEIPYSEISYSPVSDDNDYSMSAALTFRNGRAPVTE